MQKPEETWVQSLGQEDPLEKAMATYSSILAWGIPWSPLALFILMLPNTHLTTHSRMSGSRLVTTPSWLSGPWRPFLYSSSVYSCQAGRGITPISASRKCPGCPVVKTPHFHFLISHPKRWCCESASLNIPANLENSAVATGLEKVSFHFNLKRRAMPKNVQTTAQLNSLTH